jgi:UbiD family decarboxylase
VDRVTRRLDPLTTAGQELVRHEGSLVILEDVGGHRVVSGVVGSRVLLAEAVGAAPEGLPATLADRMDQPGPVRVVEQAPFLECSPSLTGELTDLVPLLRHDPGSSRPYASASIIAARSARHGMNLSFHRMMYVGDNRFAVRVVPRHLRMILDEAQGQGEVAVLFGLHPALCLAAATSGGPDFSELAFAASLLGDLEVFDLDGLQLPAGAELVLRGRFTGELAPEGPFVDLTGTLDGTREQPVLEITAVYHRRDFLYHALVPGGVEHRLLMGSPQEPRIWRAVTNTFPRVRALALTEGGCHWLHAVVALDRPRPGQAKNVGLAALGAHPSLKRVVVVDDDIDIHDTQQVEWAIATRVQADQDLVVVAGARGSSLDPSRNVEDNSTAKWIIDATRPAGRDVAEFVRAEALPRCDEDLPGGTA